MGLLERIREGEVLLSDGAVGTYLQGKGLAIGDAPETWNLSHPDVVRQMAAITLSFGLISPNLYPQSHLMTSAIASMCCGVVPQQPPIIPAPASTSSAQ